MRQTNAEAFTAIYEAIDNAQSTLERNGMVLVAIQLRRALAEVRAAHQYMRALAEVQA